MREFWNVLTAILPIFALVGIGALLRRTHWLTEQADHSLLRICVNLLLPSFVFDAILGNTALREWNNLYQAPLIGFSLVTIGLIAAYFTAPLFGLSDPVSRRTFAYVTGIFNYGYLPIPMSQRLFDHETLGVLLVHNFGTEIAIWTICLMTLTGGGWRKGIKQLLNPVLLAVLIGVLLNLTHQYESIPTFVLTTIHMLGLSAVPVALLMIGAAMYDHAGSLNLTTRPLPAFGGCFLRLALLPITFLLLAKYLPLSVELKRVILLQAAMPAGILPVVLVKHYHGDTPTAVQVVLTSSLVGLLTIPCWVQLGMWWIFGA